MPRKDRHELTRRAYAYLQRLAATGEPYSDEGMISETGWKPRAVSTYRSKHWKEWVKRDGSGVWQVLPIFASVTEKEFIALHHQRTNFYDSYQRKFYGSVVTYEFLLPLTKERELTIALDALFYRDTLERIIRQTGVDDFGPQFATESQKNEGEAVNEIAEFVADHFTGYSISHVSGRFRTEDIVTRAQAGEMFAEGQRYLFDETTAIVRFIVPLRMTERVYQEGNLDTVVDGDTVTTSNSEATAELARIRRAFLHIFAEAVVRTVKGEDQVWLIESGPENRLYVWEKA